MDYTPGSMGYNKMVTWASQNNNNFLSIFTINENLDYHFYKKINDLIGQKTDNLRFTGSPDWEVPFSFHQFLKFLMKIQQKKTLLKNNCK